MALEHIILWVPCFSSICGNNEETSQSDHVISTSRHTMQAGFVGWILWNNQGAQMAGEFDYTKNTK